MSNAPFLIWPNMATALHPDLRWIVEHRADIEKAWPIGGGKPGVVRPVKVWPDGRVRVEFVHTWPSFAAARCDCEQRIRVSGPEGANEVSSSSEQSEENGAKRTP